MEQSFLKQKKKNKRDFFVSIAFSIVTSSDFHIFFSLLTLATKRRKILDSKEWKAAINLNISIYPVKLNEKTIKGEFLFFVYHVIVNMDIWLSDITLTCIFYDSISSAVQKYKRTNFFFPWIVVLPFETAFLPPLLQYTKIEKVFMWNRNTYTHGIGLCFFMEI